MALIAVAADKGAPGVTTSAVVLAAVWPRPVLLAECDPAGGDLIYRLPAAGGGRLDPQRGLLSLAVAGRRGIQPRDVWEHTQKLHGGLDVLTGVTGAEQGAGLEPMWDAIGSAFARLPQADVIADCGRIGVDGPHYDLLARASAVVFITRDTLAEVVRLRERAAVLTAALGRRNSFGTRISVVVVAEHKRFHSALGEVGRALSHGRVRLGVAGGLAYEPKSAEQLRGEWGGKLDKSLLIRTARDVATQLAVMLPAIGSPGPGEGAAGGPGRPPAAAPRAGQAAANWQPEPGRLPSGSAAGADPRQMMPARHRPVPPPGRERPAPPAAGPAAGRLLPPAQPALPQPPPPAGRPAGPHPLPQLPPPGPGWPEQQPGRGAALSAGPDAPRPEPGDAPQMRAVMNREHELIGQAPARPQRTGDQDLADRLPVQAGLPAPDWRAGEAPAPDSEQPRPDTRRAGGG